MTNPYQPPQESADNRLVHILVPSTYFGGIWGVVSLGVLGGVMVALAIYSEALTDVIPTPFVAPAIGWVGAFFALMFMLRGSEISPGTRIILPFLLAIPAYILYVPVCTFSAMFTTGFLGANAYGPTFPGLILASVVAFLGVLLIFAAILRRRFKQRVYVEDPIARPTVQTDFNTPINEASND